jgi:tetratricopeptide (TPR) repeat protein
MVFLRHADVSLRLWSGAVHKGQLFPCDIRKSILNDTQKDYPGKNARKVIGGVLLCFLIASAPARAGSDEVACSGPISNATVGACTRLINSGRYTGNNAVAVYFNRANGYRVKGSKEQAISDYTKVIQLSGGDVEAYNNRGALYDEQGKDDQALADYIKALRLDPQYAMTYYNRGGLYDKQGKSEQALVDYSTAIRLDPQYSKAYNNRGALYDKLGKYEQALADFSSAIRLDPEYAKAYRNRGLALERLGQVKEAIADYRKAVSLDSSDAESIEALKKLGEK